MVSAIAAKDEINRRGMRNQNPGAEGIASVRRHEPKGYPLGIYTILGYGY